MQALNKSSVPIIFLLFFVFLLVLNYFSSAQICLAWFYFHNAFIYFFFCSACVNFEGFKFEQWLMPGLAGILRSWFRWLISSRFLTFSELIWTIMWYDWIDIVVENCRLIEGSSVILHLNFVCHCNRVNIFITMISFKY